jgi:hypothetical protein
MANRIPLVLVNGQVQQLQSGDAISVPSATYDGRTATNAESSAALTAGMPVYISGNSAVKRAQANAAGTAGVAGIWLDPSTAAAASGNYAAGGVAVCTTAQWDAVTGATGGLTAGSLYFLDAATAGKLTTTAPSTAAQLVTLVGRALSTTDMEMLLELPILL